MKRRSRKKQQNGAFHGDLQQPLNHERQRHSGRQQHDKSHRPDFRNHDFKRRHRHHQKVFQRSVLALADQRGTGQNDRQHRNVVDELHHRPEPRLRQIRIEAVALHNLHGCGCAAVPRQERGNLPLDDLLDIPAPGERLRHARGVDVQLNCGRTPRQDILLEAVRYHDDERIRSVVHQRVDLRTGNLFCAQEHRREESIRDVMRKLGAVLVDHGNRSIGNGIRLRRRGGVNSESEHVKNQNQHQRIAEESAQFLDAELPDVFQFLFQHA